VPVVQIIYSDRVSHNNKKFKKGMGIGLSPALSKKWLEGNEDKIINQHRVSNRVLSYIFQNLHGLDQILYLFGIVYVLYFPTSFVVNICSIINISLLI
jgi:hypothetical protein